MFVGNEGVAGAHSGSIARARFMVPVVARARRQSLLAAAVRPSSGMTEVALFEGEASLVILPGVSPGPCAERADYFGGIGAISPRLRPPGYWYDVYEP